MNYDLQMSKDDDLLFFNGDIVKTESVAQAVLIHLRWFFEEWVYGPQYGVDYFGKVFIKNPNTTHITNMIAAEIKKVDKVKTVRDIRISVNRATREAILYFTVVTTDKKVFDQEVDILSFTNQRSPIQYRERNGRIVISSTIGTAHGELYLEDGELIFERDAELDNRVTYELVDGELIEYRH